MAKLSKNPQKCLGNRAGADAGADLKNNFLMIPDKDFWKILSENGILKLSRKLQNVSKSLEFQKN